MVAENTRIELSEFIAQIRAQDALDREDQYWAAHRVDFYKARARVFIQRKV